MRPWWPRLSLAVVAGVGAATFAVALAGTAAWLIVTAAGGVPVFTLMVAIVVVRTCGIGRAVLRYVERLASHDAVLRMFATIRTKVLLGVADRLRSGRRPLTDADALVRTTADVDDLQGAVIRGLLPWLASALASSAVVAASVVILPKAGWPLLGLLTFGIVVVPALMYRAEGRREDRAVAVRGDRDRLVAEMLDGMDDLVATGRSPDAVEDVSALDAELAALTRTRAVAGGARAALAVGLTGAGSVIAVMVGLPAVRTGNLDPVLFAVTVLLPLALGDAVRSALDSSTALARTSAASRRILELLAPIPVTAPAVAPAGPQGRPRVLRLEGVSVRWPGTSVDALTNVDLQLAAGERVAVVGPSGAGKSTLAAVLLGLLPLRTGRITVDGVVVSGPPSAAWVPAQAHLFDSTIDRNIRLGAATAADAIIESASATADLADWLESLPLGSKTRVGPGGRQVSGGQRQRVAVARALAALDADAEHSRFLLVADEPSAHLDATSADAVTQSLLTEDRSRVTVLITHRRKDLAQVDRVLTVEGGTVREVTHSGSRTPVDLGSSRDLLPCPR